MACKPHTLIERRALWHAAKRLVVGGMSKHEAVIAVGCEIHTIDHWREHWREIADEHNVDVSEKDVERVFTKIKGEDQ